MLENLAIDLLESARVDGTYFEIEFDS